MNLPKVREQVEIIQKERSEDLQVAVNAELSRIQDHEDYMGHVVDFTFFSSFSVAVITINFKVSETEGPSATPASDVLNSIGKSLESALKPTMDQLAKIGKQIDSWRPGE